MPKKFNFMTFVLNFTPKWLCFPQERILWNHFSVWWFPILYMNTGLPTPYINTVQWLCFDDMQSSGIWQTLTHSSYLQDSLSHTTILPLSHSSVDTGLSLCWTALSSGNEQGYHLKMLVKMCLNSL